MSSDLEEQEDELLALHSILGSEEFVRNESKPGGEIRVSVELPAAFTVSLKEGQTVRQYEISSLPPLLLTFELPEDYPSSSPPSFTLSCSWLTHSQLSALGAQLTDVYQATGGAVVLFSWSQFLKEEALGHLDIHTVLELPAGEHGTQHCSQDSQKLSETKRNQDTPESGSKDDQSCTVSDLSVPTSVIVDGQNLPTSDSLGAVASHQNNLPPHHSKVILSGPGSGPSHGSNQTAEQASEQTSESNADSLSDLSPVAGKLKHLIFAESAQNGRGDFLNQGNVSASLLLPSSPVGVLDQSEQRAAPQPIHRRDSFQNKEQTLSGLSLTPSQALLSQLLIHDAAQKKKVFASTEFECGVCSVGWLGLQCVQLAECSHIFCQACLTEFCKIQITEGNVWGVTCPHADCTASPTPAQVRSLEGEELFSRYDRLLLQSSLDLMPDVAYCPRHLCGSPVILEKSSTAALCSVCHFAFCVTCRKTYHGTADCQAKTKKQSEDPDYLALPQTLEGVKALWNDYNSGSKERQRLLNSRYGAKTLQRTMENALSDQWILHNSKSCPHCFCRIEKNGGCNRMKCSQCNQPFCWACLTMVSIDDQQFQCKCPPRIRF